MNIRNILIFIFVGLTIPCIAQKITYNYLVDTTNIEIKQVQQLFENYIHSQPDSIYNNPFWSDYDKQNKGHFDILYGEFQPSLYMGFPIHVLSIKSQNGIYEIKSMFSSCSQDNQPYVLAIMNYIAKKKSNEFKLSNYLNYSKTKWNKQKIGLVTFYYPLYHQFDSIKANKLNHFSIELCKNLKISPVEYEYYFADDFDELQKLKGIDYYIGMGGEVKPTGRGGNGMVFCSGMGEAYFHEPFHVLVGSKYKSHLWVAEGMATYLGGSRGKPLNWHIKRVNSYLTSHKEIDLNNLLSLRTMDEYTDYRYVLGGLIAKKIFEKGGWDLIREFMNSGYSDKDYYNAIEKYIGVKRSDLNTYLRSQLKLEANK